MPLSLNGRWLSYNPDTNPNDPTPYIPVDNFLGLQIDSSGNLTDVVGIFNINHPTAGTTELFDTGSFNVDSGDMGGSRFLNLTGQLGPGGISANGIGTSSEGGSSWSSSFDMELAPAVSPLSGTWSGVLDDGVSTYPFTITFDDGHNVTGVTGLGTFLGGNSVCLTDGDAVVFFYNTDNDQIKLVGTVSGNTFNGSYGADLPVLTMGDKGTFSLTR